MSERYTVICETRSDGDGDVRVVVAPNNDLEDAEREALVAACKRAVRAARELLGEDDVFATETDSPDVPDIWEVPVCPVCRAGCTESVGAFAVCDQHGRFTPASAQ